MKRLKRYEVTFTNGGEVCVDYWFAHSDRECYKTAIDQYRQDYGSAVRIVKIVLSMD